MHIACLKPLVSDRKLMSTEITCTVENELLLKIPGPSGSNDYLFENGRVLLSGTVVWPSVDR